MPYAQSGSSGVGPVSERKSARADHHASIDDDAEASRSPCSLSSRNTYVSPCRSFVKSYPFVDSVAGLTCAPFGMGVGPHSGTVKRGRSSKAYAAAPSAGDGQCNALAATFAASPVFPTVPFQSTRPLPSAAVTVARAKRPAPDENAPNVRPSRGVEPDAAASSQHMRLPGAHTHAAQPSGAAFTVPAHRPQQAAAVATCGTPFGYFCSRTAPTASWFGCALVCAAHCWAGGGGTGAGCVGGRWTW